MPQVPIELFSMYDDRNCDTETMTWEEETSLDALETNLNEEILNVCRKLFMLFEFWELDPGVMEGVLRQFMNSRL